MLQYRHVLHGACPAFSFPSAVQEPLPWRELAVLMDPIERIKIKKDTSFAPAGGQRRGWHLNYLVQGGLALRGGEAWGCLAPLQVRDDPADWFTWVPPRGRRCRACNWCSNAGPAVRRPVLYDTHVLDRAEQAGVMVVNRPGRCATPTRSSSP